MAGRGPGFQLLRPHFIKGGFGGLAQFAAGGVVVCKNQRIQYRFGSARLRSLVRTHLFVGIERIHLRPQRDPLYNVVQHGGFDR